MIPDRDLACLLVPDKSGDMKVAYDTLWTHFGRGEQEDGQPITGGTAPTSTVGNISVPDALRLISEKLEQRLEILPGAMGSGNSVPRVFKFFNPTGRKVGITSKEFRNGLCKYTLLQFEESMWAKVCPEVFAEQGGYLDEQHFAELFMPDGSTGLRPDMSELNQLQLVHKVREQMNVLQV